MNVLAVDTASVSGVARIWLEGGSIMQTWSELDLMSPFKKEPERRMIAYRNALNEIIQTNKPDLFVFEKPHLRGGNSFLLAGLRAVNVMCAYDHEVPYLEIHTSQVKKFATGKGNADKEEMMAAVRKRLIPQDQALTDNEADALMLAYYGWREYLKLPAMPTDTNAPQTAHSCIFVQGTYTA